LNPSSHPIVPMPFKINPKDSSALKPWTWALERLAISQLWISTTRPDRRPHLMLGWGIWWLDAFLVSHGAATRKVKISPRTLTCHRGLKRPTKPSSWKALPGIKIVPSGSNSSELNASICGDVGAHFARFPGMRLSFTTANCLRPDEHSENFTDAVNPLAFLNSRLKFLHVSHCFGPLSTSLANVPRAVRSTRSTMLYLAVLSIHCAYSVMGLPNLVLGRPLRRPIPA